MSSMYSDTASRLARVAPQIRPAGIAGDYTKPTARDLTSSYSPDSCPTPDGIKKFHHRGPEVGQTQRHWGLSADAPADENVRYGVKAASSGGIDECLRPAVYGDKMTSLIGEQREKNYASERQRPLGRCPEPPYPVPVPRNGFGISSDKGETTASTISAMRDVDVRHAAGAQTDRGYDWQTAGVDPSQHRFGATTAKGESAREVLVSGKETELMPKVVKDYKSTVAYEIGKPRSYGFDNPAEWDDSKRRATGAGSGSMKASASNGFQAEQPTVKELLSTWAVAPNASGRGEADEGESDTRRTTDGGSGDALRATVCTTTRDGRSATALAALEDAASAQQLVHPCHYVTLGVQSAYFAGGRDLENVRALANKCGFGMTDAQIDEIFAANAVNGLCGIEQFKNAAMAKGYM